MPAFYHSIGLFASKIIILAVLALVFISFVIWILSTKPRERETLIVENINDKLQALKEAMELEVLDKKQLKILKKMKKKIDKAKKNEEHPLEKNNLFVMRFNGDIHASEVDNLRETINATLSIAQNNDEILVILESAGGLVHQYGLGASQLERIRSKGIKLHVAVDLVAASGGYLMACVADHILAAPFAIIGSIGVVAQIPNFNRLLNKHNVDIEHHTAGQYKTTLTMLGENTPEAREKFKAELEETHHLFKSFVKEKRPQLDIENIATGEHWYGTQAKTLGLIDQIATSDDFIIAQCEKMQIFEISIIINESFKDKLAKKLGLMGLKCLQTLGGLWANVIR